MSDNPEDNPNSKLTPSQAHRNARVARALQRFSQASGASAQAGRIAWEWARKQERDAGNPDEDTDRFVRPEIREEADPTRAQSQRTAAEADELAHHRAAMTHAAQYFLEKDAANGADLIEWAAALTVAMLGSGLVPAPYVNALRWALRALDGNPTAQTLIDRDAQALYDAWAREHPAEAALNAQAEAEEITEHERWKEEHQDDHSNGGNVTAR